MKENYEILVLDDESIVCDRVKNYLQKKGYSVETFTQSNLAMDRLKEKYFDVLVTDIRMAGKDGMDVLISTKNILGRLFFLPWSKYVSFLFILIDCHFSLSLVNQIQYTLKYLSINPQASTKHNIDQDSFGPNDDGHDDVNPLTSIFLSNNTKSPLL